MKKYGLIGYPLGHSFSKKYFTEKFAREGLTDCHYDNYELDDISQLENLLDGNRDLHGLNVTIPYKTSVIDRLDIIDEDASDVGAVNIIKIYRDSGSRFLKGYNSDIYGFRESLVPYLDEYTRSALILGTGGSSLAVEWVLGKLNIKCLKVSRNPAGDSIGYHDITRDLLSGIQLIINTTPLGMFPGIDKKPAINYDFLHSSHILYDLIYNPEITGFMQEGRRRGCKVIGGYSMLVLQAEKSWEIWTAIDS